MRFLGWQSNEVIRDHMRRCKALLFPGEDDFGIVPVEAQACGSPVIAFARGGAVETVLAGPDATGIHFEQQTPDCLIAAIEELEYNPQRFSPATARQNALRFRSERFEAEFFGVVEELVLSQTAV